jgi:hypothetical protein
MTSFAGEAIVSRDRINNTFMRGAKMKPFFKMGFCVLVALLFCSLQGCTLHCTKEITEKLDIEDLYKNYAVTARDLASMSKCKEPPTVRIENAETRTEDFEALQNPPFTGNINPKEFMDGVAQYIAKNYERSNIRIDAKSSKVLRIKMLDIKTTAGVWGFGSYYKMNLEIPEKNFSRFYESRDSTFNGYTAAAYAIHTATRQVVDDPAIQDYILCK